MDIKEAGQNWNELGVDDPMWVVLTDPDKKGCLWNEEDFFATGRVEISHMLQRIKAAGVPLLKGSALDFGCGVGRLSQALAQTFDSVDGVDISASMIRHAERLNRAPQRVRFHLNVRSDLSTFSSGNYDFICSMIALQHTPPRFQLSYIADFVRLLKPNGCACFQTIHARGWRKWVPNSFADHIRKWRSGGKAFIPLYGLPIRSICKTVERSGGQVVSAESDGYPGWESRFATDLFVIKKNCG